MGYLRIQTENNMKFDVIVGNPPYQESDGGGTGDSAKPIYHNFIQQSIDIKPDYIIMIVPSRWMKGGKGLVEFRTEMMNDRRIRILYDYENAKECFPNIDLDGGVCYFLWDSKYNGMVDYHSYTLDKEVIKSKRYLKTEFSDTVIRDVRQSSIIEKASKANEKKFSTIVSSRNPYNFAADYFNNPEKYSDLKTSNHIFSNSYKIYGIKGKKGGSKRVFGYIYIDNLTKNKNSATEHKLFFSKAYMTTSTVPPEIIIGEPNEICTETFLEIGTFPTKEENLKCLQYIKTKFFRALLFFNRSSLNISQGTFDLIPLQDFTEEWTDEKLYLKYGLSSEEVGFIESIVKPME